METVKLIVTIVQVIISVVLVVVVLMQSGKEAGLGAISGNNDSFFGKNKNSAFEAKMALGTKISAVAFVVLALLMVIFG